MSADDSTPLEIENLSRLKLFNNRFEYSGEDYEYEAVRHLNYSATRTRHSINFIPVGSTYSTNLSLEFSGGAQVSIDADSNSFSGRKGFTATARAAAILSHITFWNRLKGYEEDLKAKGYMIWGRYQITRRGEIFFDHEFLAPIDSKAISLRLAAFSVQVAKTQKDFGAWLKSAWSGDHEIPISRDRDCFLYVMKHYFRLSWSGEEVPDRPSRTQSFEERKSPPPDAIRERYLMILGLRLGASDQDIKTAYKNLVRQHHPDALRSQGHSSDDLIRAEELLKVINQAYAVLMREN